MSRVLTTADVAHCVEAYKEHLIADAVIKGRPVEGWVKGWLGQEDDRFGCTREEFTEAVAHMIKEKMYAGKNTAPAPVEYAGIFR
jgi:hypothetical protein